MIKKFIDLHIHSYFSDGMKSTEEIIKWAKNLKLEIISLTDHNNIFGVKKIIELGKKENIGIISGIEMYVHYKNQIVHLLGYNFDIKDNYLNQLLENNQEEENKRVKKIIFKLNKLGLKISWGDFKKQISSKFIDNGHIASVLLSHSENKKFFTFKKNAIEMIVKKYLNRGMPAYLPLVYLNFKQVAEAIHKADGIIILAHPGQTFGYLKEKDLKILIKKGIDGIEVVSRHHSEKQTKYYLELTKKYNLKITGGTDWHKFGDENKNGQRLKIPYQFYLDLDIRLKN